VKEGAYSFQQPHHVKFPQGVGVGSLLRNATVVTLSRTTCRLRYQPLGLPGGLYAKTAAYTHSQTAILDNDDATSGF
jgi:hypothetical protein